MGLQASGWDGTQENTPAGLPWGPHLYNLVLSLLQLVRLAGPQQASLSLSLLL